MSDELKNIGEEVVNETKDAFFDVKEEATEVFQEAKAAIRGETLNTANVVGGAGYRAAEDPTLKTPAIPSLVLGIISLVLGFIGFFVFALGDIFGLILGIIGLVLGAKARKISQTSTATAGFVCSLIGVIINGIGLVCLICAGALIGIAGR